MPRIRMIESGEGSAEVQARFEHQVAHNGRITNMKRTLLHSVPAFDAYMSWYTLREELLPFIGERGVIVFSHAISTASDCLICSTFFRRYLIDAGEDPNQLTLNPQEALLVEFGKQIVKDSNGVSDDLFERLRAHFDQRQILLLTAFAGIMIATNTLNNVLRVPLDDYLATYRDNTKHGVS